MAGSWFGVDTDTVRDLSGLWVGQQISSVSVRITSDIEAGRDGGKVAAAVSDSRYSVTGCHITDPPEGRWEEGIRPRIRITLEAEEENYFKNHFSKSDVFLSGTE